MQNQEILVQETIIATNKGVANFVSSRKGV